MPKNPYKHRASYKAAYTYSARSSKVEVRTAYSRIEVNKMWIFKNSKELLEPLLSLQISTI